MRMSPLAGCIATFFIAATWGAGCGSSSVDAINGPPSGNGNDGGNGGNNGGDSPGGGFSDGGRADGSRPGDRDSGTNPGDFCRGTGAAIPLPGGSLCTGDLGRKLFKMAACSCSNMDISGDILTDSFNSSTGSSNRSGGSLGTNEKLVVNGRFNIGGSGYAANVRKDTGTVLTLGADGTLKNDTWAGGETRAQGTVTVGGDVHAKGDVNGTNESVTKANGKVHIPDTKSVTGFGSTGVVTAPDANVVIPTPCDCTNKLDIANIVSPFKTANDNAVAGITEDVLVQGGAVTLPCGKYYLSKIGGAAITLNIQGRVAVFVAGDLDTAGKFDINLAPGAEIDLFVAGKFRMAGDSGFGSVAAPSKVRVYVGGPTFEIAGRANVGGNFYAPNAPVIPSGKFEISGAIFAESLRFAGGLTIHYDEAILDVPGCRPPTQTCNSCNDCANACKGGQCGGCEKNSDCCAPLVCSSGRCVPDIR
ncbi:hypothetical protein [Pendulispora albinea]|uniref:DUF7305 domain-containing protein n=1 Tax=Pendulispora albinea TaxID=2741071 RepID=A0ABZ2MCA3_9BACT